MTAESRRAARLLALAALDAYRSASGHGLHRAIAGYVAAVKEGREPPVPGLSGLSVNSLARWHAARARGHDLAGAYGNRASSGSIEMPLAAPPNLATPRLIDWLTAAHCARPHLSTQALHHLMQAEFGDRVSVRLPDGSIALRGLPSLRQVQRALSAWKGTNRQIVAAVTDPDGWRNRHLVAVGRADGIAPHPNAVWEIDASPTDVMLTDGRHQIYIAIDIHTRRMMGYVARTAAAQAAMLALRRAILAWGLPSALRIDNGSDFGSHAFQGLLAALEIAHIRLPAHAPDRKGIVERAIGTVQHGLMPLLPGYTGASVAEAQKIRATRSFAERLGATDRDLYHVALDREGLQARLDAWLSGEYARRPHDGLQGRSPAEVAAAATRAVKRIDNPRALDLLLAPSAGGRAVTKKGLKIERAWFWSHALIPYIGTGERLEVRLDPEDMGRAVVYTAGLQRFVCIAECPERLGIDRRQLAAEARRLQRDFLRAGSTALRRAARQIDMAALADRHIGAAAGQLAAPGRPATVIAFPPPSVPHATPALQATAAALQAAVEAPPAPLTDAEQARQARLIQLAARPAPREETPDERFQRWLALRDRRDAGDPLDPADLAWVTGYATTPECRARLRVRAALGRQLTA
ncbi:MAG: hypothetical protein OHK0024_21200 [Thalassobaculales bacterium]